MGIEKITGGLGYTLGNKNIFMSYGEDKSPLDIQIGGDHYKSFVIQPIEFVTKNNIGFIPGCVIKRMARYNQPTGKGIQDLEKAKHEIEILIHIEKERGMK